MRINMIQFLGMFISELFFIGLSLYFIFISSARYRKIGVSIGLACIIISILLYSFADYLYK